MLVDAETHLWLLAHPGAEVEIDLEALTVTLPDGRRAGFPMEAFARHCLLHGVDELGYLLSRLPAIEAYERSHAL
jgi:3-isopropylmalate/(R)-2-methylmalate dehydratase small subunit